MQYPHTHYSQHGYRFNVRDCYRGLPFQAFWTWVTGKGLPLTEDELNAAKAPMGERFLLLHLGYTWFLLALSFLGGAWALRFGYWWLLPLSWVLTINRFRSLQATFHYLTHGSVTRDIERAKRYAMVLITTPLLYISWDNYKKSHVREHHHLRVLCTETDPDQAFIKKQGFRHGMPEWEYWVRIALTPFRPSYLLNDWWVMIKDNFVDPAKTEVAYRAMFWLALLSLVHLGGLWTAWFCLFALPRLVLFTHSMWLQLITEHLWFYQKKEDQSRKEFYGHLTWGRFQGRPLPESTAGKLGWVIKILLLDIPVRLYIYPQDLPNHDFHHRMPLVNYRHIANVRATLEATPSDYGPMLEVWGFLSTLFMIRDHLCRGMNEPFSESGPFNRNPQPSTGTSHASTY